jgi:hypothetical protein
MIQEMVEWISYINDGHVSTSESEISAALESLRDEVLRGAARKILVELPDPNPLASIFKPYVGTLAANLIYPKE